MGDKAALSGCSENNPASVDAHSSIKVDSSEVADSSTQVANESNEPDKAALTECSEISPESSHTHSGAKVDSNELGDSSATSACNLHEEEGVKCNKETDDVTAAETG